MWYLNLEHFLETERLRAQLQVRGRSVPYAGLVFDGTNRTVRDFDGVSAAGQSQRLRPERDRPEHLPSPLLAILSAIYPPVRAGAPDGVGVVTPDAVAVNEGALPRAVHEVLDRGNLDDGFRVHSRSASESYRPVAVASALVLDGPPSLMYTDPLPCTPLRRVPGVHQGVDAVAVERLAPCWPMESASLLASRSLPPPPLRHGDAGRAGQPFIDPAPSHRQDGEGRRRRAPRRPDQPSCRSGLTTSQVWSGRTPARCHEPDPPVPPRIPEAAPPGQSTCAWTFSSRW